jgi:hypothetical protein
MKNAIPSAALAQHIAFLGKTGSGKTSTAKLAVEQILREDPGARVCVLDPIKSDWWGLTSSASGKRPGLPFHILGGPRGHVPLHPSAGKAIGELVATGALPLSIIDMADFPLGGLQEFFNAFAPALLRKMRGVVYLVMEEAHEFAPKERAGHAGENMTVHFAKKLATAGRSKGIRLMVLTQRTQALHNALLGSCDTMVAHRLTAPADQKPVADWLKANVTKEILEKVAASLAKLRTGTGWICSGEAQVAELVEFPHITTFDNSATPTGNGADQDDVATAPVDKDKLRAIIGDAVEEAKADHVPTLKARIKELEAEVAKKPAPAAAPSAEALLEARSEGWRYGRDEGASAMSKQWQERVDRFRGAHVAAMSDLVAPMPLLPPLEWPTPPASRGIVTQTGPASARLDYPPAAPLKSPPKPFAVGQVAGELEGREQRVLDAIAWWSAVGVAEPARIQVAAAARYTVKSTSFTNPLSGLKSKGLITYQAGGKLAMTDEGRALANAPDSRPTTAELHERVRGILEGREWRLLEPLITAYPAGMTREELAERTNYSPTSTSFTNPLSGLKSLGLVDVPRGGGHVRALPILFVE